MPAYVVSLLSAVTPTTTGSGDDIAQILEFVGAMIGILALATLGFYELAHTINARVDETNARIEKVEASVNGLNRELGEMTSDLKNSTSQNQPYPYHQARTERQYPSNIKNFPDEGSDTGKQEKPAGEPILTDIDPQYRPTASKVKQDIYKPRVIGGARIIGSSPSDKEKASER